MCGAGMPRGIHIGQTHVYLAFKNRKLAGWISVFVGVAMLAWPLVWPSRYLAAPVWLGFIFLLEPINIGLGADSLFEESRTGGYPQIKTSC
jgi:hypothetical protein